MNDKLQLPHLDYAALSPMLILFGAAAAALVARRRLGKNGAADAVDAETGGDEMTEA